jgi:PAS domain S-box-containing protein
MRRWRRVSQFASAAAMSVGTVVLLGWTLEMDSLKSVFPGLPPMKAHAALCIALTGAALWSVASRGSTLQTGFAVVLGGIATAVALVTLAEYVLGWQTAVDQFLFNDPYSVLSPAGRMAPNTAFCLLLLGGGVLSLAAGRIPWAQILAFISAGITLSALIGYTYGAAFLYRPFSFAGMAVHSTLALLSLSIGLLFARADKGPMAVVSNDRLSGMMSRRLLPTSFVLLTLIGLMVQLGAKEGLYDVEFGPSIFVVVSLSVTGVAIWWVASSLDPIDAQRRQAEATVAEAEARYRDLYENAPDAMASIDAATGRIIDCNRALEALSGRTEFELSSRAILELYDLQSVPAAKAALEEFFRTGEARNVELKVRGNQGSIIDVSMNMTAVRDSRGRIIRGRAIWRDIRERKRFEEERLELLMREREVLLEAQAAQQVKEEFLRMLSHELRTPLTSIIGWARLLQSPDVSHDRLSHGLDVIYRNANLESRLLNKMLDMSTMLSGDIRAAEIEMVDMQAVLRNAINAVRPSANEKRLEVVTDVRGVEAHVQGNSARLHEMLSQILSNAVKFTPNHGRVNVTLDASGKFVELLVEDTGIGIDPDFLPFVFDRFRQADSSPTRRHGGLGLGLAIVRSVVERHGGTVTANSAGEGQGTSVSVRLPRKHTQRVKTSHASPM